MARPLRLEFPGACYHVINGDNIRFSVFREVHDRELILEKLVDFAERFQVRIRTVAAPLALTNRTLPNRHLSVPQRGDARRVEMTIPRDRGAAVAPVKM